MSFWTESSIEPKRNFRFRVTITGFGDDSVNILVNAGYKVKGKDDTQTTMSKANSVGATTAVIVTILNSEGNTIEEWTLKNAWLKGATFSDLSYEDDGLRTIDLTWRYDWAECVHGDGSGEFSTNVTT